MLDAVVRGHAECTRLLLDHQAVGTNWLHDHYSGNFWWARSEHVRRLPDIRALRAAPRALRGDPTLNLRLQCEFWVAMTRGRFANLGVSGLDLYRTARWTATAADVINDLLMSVAGDRYTELVTDGPSPYMNSVNAEVKRSVPARSASRRSPWATPTWSSSIPGTTRTTASRCSKPAWPRPAAVPRSSCMTAIRRPSGISAREPSTYREASGTAPSGRPSCASGGRTRTSGCARSTPTGAAR